MSKETFTLMKRSRKDNGAYGNCPYCGTYNLNCTIIEDIFEVLYECDNGEHNELSRKYMETDYFYPNCIGCGVDLTPREDEKIVEDKDEGIPVMCDCCNIKQIGINRAKSATDFVDVYGICTGCEALICEDCTIEVNGDSFCKNCYVIVLENTILRLRSSAMQADEGDELLMDALKFALATLENIRATLGFTVREQVYDLRENLDDIINDAEKSKITWHEAYDQMKAEFEGSE